MIIEQITSEQKEVKTNQIEYITHLKVYLNNIPTPSLSTLFGRNIAEQISILTTDKLSYTNCTRTALVVGDNYRVKKAHNS